jgi:hypothetical protein
MYRRDTEKMVHNHFQKNASDEVQFEGVQFTDGTVAVRWCTACASTSIWNSIEDMLIIHGHPEYGSELIWLDQ